MKDLPPPPPTREDVVVEKADELLQRLPTNFVEDIYREQLDRQGGLSVPLNLHIFFSSSKHKCLKSLINLGALIAVIKPMFNP